MTQIRQVTLQAPATNTTQDYTVSGFGTPTAAIVIYSRGSSGSWGAHGCTGMGFWDGSNQNTCQAGWENAVNPGTSSSRHLTDASNVISIARDGPEIGSRTASITSTVTDGVRLTWAGGNTGIRPYATVILINGINGAQVGHRTASTTIDGTTQTITTGLTPKLILFAGRRSDVATGSSSEPGVFWGFACDNGSSIDQGAFGLRNRDIDPTDCNGTIHNNYACFCDVSTGGADTGAIDVTTMTSGSFTTTTRNNVPVFSSHNYMVLDFDESVVGWDASTPTASGDFDPFTASFTPQWAFMFPTAHAAINTSYGGTQEGQQGMGVYSVNSSGEEDGHYSVFENGSTGVGTMYGQHKHHSRFDTVTVVSSAATSRAFGDSPTFDSSGIVYADADFTHHSTARQVVGFFVEEASAGSSIVPAAMHHYRHHGNL